VGYVDSLLADMKLTAHRKKDWMKDFFTPFLPRDLGEAWKEYLELYGRG